LLRGGHASHDCDRLKGGRGTGEVTPSLKFCKAQYQNSDERLIIINNYEHRGRRRRRRVRIIILIIIISPDEPHSKDLYPFFLSFLLLFIQGILID
jgi:hypothetical protein